MNAGTDPHLSLALSPPIRMGAEREQQKNANFFRHVQRLGTGFTNWKAIIVTLHWRVPLHLEKTK